MDNLLELIKWEKLILAMKETIYMTSISVIATFLIGLLLGLLFKLDELIETLLDKDVFILVDADDAGEKLRKQFKREFPEAEHLYIDRMYREVATAPEHHLATVLLGANIDVNMEFLDRG